SAGLQDSRILLQWTNKNEQGLLEYQLERSSDGIHFTTISRSAATGKSSYQYTDQNITAAGNLYYRVKLINNQGGFMYSSVVSVRLNATGPDFSVYPNPFIDAVTVRTTAEARGSLGIRIMDATGKLVREGSASVQAGTNFIPFGNLSSLTKGIYYLQTTINGKTTQSKLMKL
ncbi:MAG: T9SS type A sorting domain-containing protein, partial [Bacteroidota bacterium]|nr:T9SS type A sorting domain-containing protein [Bacteroidota bacterium]